MNYKISQAKRLVIKVGSALLVDNSQNILHRIWLESFLQDVAQCWQNGQEIVLVSSGAIALGRRHLKLKNTPLLLEEKQASAAVGQIKLAHIYQEILEKQGIIGAQVLLTLDDSENRRRYLNAQNTLETLLKLRAIPIINENDTIATAEIRFGDNDRLAARVAQMIGADTLILLSDIDGLYTANPRIDSTAQLIPKVSKLTPEILFMAGDSATAFGSGGMITKLAAAKIAMASGCHMVIAAGKHLHPLQRIDQTELKTWFIPETTPTHARKNWIAQHLQPKGQMTIDLGAAKALRLGKSLLSVGIIAIEGDFQKGDAICILTEEKQEIARGLSNYSAQEGKQIMGKRSGEFQAILGYCGCEEMVHRNNLVVQENN